MEREQALQAFRESISGQLREGREHMAEHLLDHAPRLEELVREGMKRLGKEMEQQKKESVSFLYGSILKTDLLQGRARFFFHGLDSAWYLDESPLEVYVDASGLLEPFAGLWKSLSEESRIYKGLVNEYDVAHRMFEELAYVDAQIAGLLRYRLRDWEKKGIFADLTLAPSWFLKWGEYRDRTECIVRMDRTVKESVQWEEALKKARHAPETLAFGYWYQGEYQGSSLQEQDLQFSVFEECHLTGIAFEKCNLEGSRFPGSRLTGCSFTECNLWGADLTDCELEQVTFQGADLTGALLPAESIPFLHLDAEQLQRVLLVRKEEV